MTMHGNALLVDDDSSWSELYARAIRKVGIESVWTAANYDEAAGKIDEVRFAVALVDIGLGGHNERNADGLRVLQKIRDTGDRTSIIVITGRSSDDAMEIARDALKKFNAYEILRKSRVDPAELRALIESGLQEYERGSGADKEPLYEALRGDMDQMVWDDMIMRKVVISGGARELYRLIDSLFTPFVPLLPGVPGGVRIENDDLACGVFWSRGIGAAVVACFGPPASVTSAVASVSADGLLLGRYAVGEVVGEYSSAAAEGVIYRLEGYPRSVFR